MKNYIIITLLSTIACFMILIQDRSIVIVSNIKPIEGIITISSSAIDTIDKKSKEWNKPIVLKDFIEINISK